MKASVQQGTEIAKNDKRKSGPNEQKGKEKVNIVTLKHDTRKLFSKKLNGATASNATIEPTMKLVGSGGELAQVEAKQESTKKHQAQKQAGIEQEKKIKGKGIVESTKQKTPSEGRKKMRRTKEKEKEK